MTGGSDLKTRGGGPDQVTLMAPAKVNLHLEVLRQRSDGFHEIETVLQAVSLFDTVKVRLRQRLSSGRPQINLRVKPPTAAPADRTNLCWQAAQCFYRHTGISGQIEIDLIKEIPMAAGLGGGSSNAAAVLLACDRLFHTHLETTQLEAMAAEIGSDVPFFVRGGTMLGRGRGTELTPLPPIRKGVFVIVKPDLNLSTSIVYDTLKMGLTVRSPKANISGMKSLIARFPTSSWFGFNRLEEVVLPSQPMLQRLVLRLRELAPLAMLSGSGAAVVAVFEEDSFSPNIADQFARSYSFVRVVGPHAAGVEFKDG